MKLISKNLIYAFLIFLLLSAFFALLTSPLETVKEIGLSELVQEINKGTVEKITVKGNDLEIALKDGAKLSAQKENEASFSESLKNYGVDSEKLAATDIIVKQPSGFLFWLGALLPFIFLVHVSAGEGRNHAGIHFRTERRPRVRPGRRKSDF